MKQASSLALFLLSALAITPGLAQQTDRVTGLKIDEDWELLQANCTRCHSAQLITQNNGTRAVWQSRLNWMRTQGLEQFQDGIDDRIIDYLARNYGPKTLARRPPIAPEYLPDNPYSPE